MGSFEEERLRILSRVEAGELTPQQGSLEIAMLKVRAQGEAAPEPEDDPQAQMPPLRAPNPVALGALLLVPFVVMGLIVVVAMTFFMALPAYLLMWAWNALVVPNVAGMAEIGFFQTLAMMVAFSLLSTLLRWRRKVKVFMNTGAAGTPFGFGFGPDAPARPRGGPGLGAGDGFREQ